MVAKFRCSRRALAVPMTFLILFVTTLGLISATYYFSVERVNAQSQNLKVSTARQNFAELDDGVMAVVWQPGAARKFEVSDSAGRLNVQPTANPVIIAVADGRDVNQTVFSQAIGQVTYELPYADSPDTGTYLKGDGRTFTNQTGGSITQLCIRNGVERAEILLRYRPAVSCAVTGEEDGKAVNDLRIYVVNLNGSDAVALMGKVPLRLSCESTHVDLFRHSLSYGPEVLQVSSTIDGENGVAYVPISSTVQGAIVNVSVVQCSVKIARSVL